MITPADDFPFHQTPHPFDTPYVNHPYWFDRYWFMTASADEGICLITGIGTYANTGRVDAYAMLNDGTTQWNLRAGRERDPNPINLDAGGLRFEIVEPMKSWRCQGTAWAEAEFDIQWNAIAAPTELPLLAVEVNGEVIMEHGHFSQAGRVDGSIRIGDRTVTPSDWQGERDHSWGFRNPGGGARSGFHAWCPAQAGDLQLWVWFRENKVGIRHGLEGYLRNTEGREWKVVDVEHELDMDLSVEPHRRVTKAHMVLTLDDGRKIDVDVEPIFPMYISAGGYVEGEDAHGTFEGTGFSRFELAGDGPAEIPVGVIDHFSHITIDGQRGQGIFELSMGRYDPMGIPSRKERDQ